MILSMLSQPAVGKLSVVYFTSPGTIFILSLFLNALYILFFIVSDVHLCLTFSFAGLWKYVAQLHSSHFSVRSCRFVPQVLEVMFPFFSALHRMSSPSPTQLSTASNSPTFIIHQLTLSWQHIVQYMQFNTSASGSI